VTDSFEAQMRGMVEDSLQALKGVFNQSVQDTINQAQLQGPSKKGTGKGGRMPVDTGFLRASGRASLEGLPSGPIKGDKDKKYPSPDKYTSTPSVKTTIATLKLGGSLWFGWTADYANAMEVRYGFLGAALQNWQSNVEKNAIEARMRLEKKRRGTS
jgi:hypothetical protein